MMTSLIGAVAAQMGYDLDERAGRIEFLQTCQDVCNGGADGGFSGFVYYGDTQEFTQDNIREIMGLVRDMSDEFGIDETGFIAGFRCLKDSGITNRDVDRWRDDESDEETTRLIENALAWFTLEEVARYVTYNEEEFEPEEADEEETDE